MNTDNLLVREIRDDECKKLVSFLSSLTDVEKSILEDDTEAAIWISAIQEQNIITVAVDEHDEIQATLSYLISAHPHTLTGKVHLHDFYVKQNDDSEELRKFMLNFAVERSSQKDFTEVSISVDEKEVEKMKELGFEEVGRLMRKKFV